MKKYISETKPLDFPELVQYYSDRLHREPSGFVFSRPFMPAYPAVWDGCWTFVIEKEDSGV